MLEVKTVTGVFIPVQTKEPIRRVQLPIFSEVELTELLRGPVEQPVPFGEGKELAYVRRSERFVESVNRRATALLSDMGALGPDDFITGGIVIVGWDWELSERDYVPQEVLSYLAPEEFVVKVAIGSEQVPTAFHAAAMLVDIASKVQEKGQMSGAGTTPDGETIIVWEFR